MQSTPESPRISLKRTTCSSLCIAGSVIIIARLPRAAACSPILCIASEPKMIREGNSRVEKDMNLPPPKLKVYEKRRLGASL
jgi:hypothetical protein